ncbi:MAG: hypothetical protein AAGA54_14535 [Myxococcota bacterium]
MMKTYALVPLTLLCACFNPKEQVSTDTDTNTNTNTNTTTGTGPSTQTADATAGAPTSTSDPSESSAGDPSESSSTTGPDTAECGDGIVTAPEVCDDGVNDGEYGGCLPGCLAPAAFCGDGEINGPEVCDDGDTVNGNGCNPDCAPSAEVVWTETRVGPSPCPDERGTGVAIGTRIFVSSEECTTESRRARLSAHDFDGTQLWEEIFDEPASQVVTGDGVDVTDDGTVILVGRSQLTGYVRAYDSRGSNLWDVRREPQDGGLSALSAATGFPGSQIATAGGETLGGGLVGFALRLSEDAGTETAAYQSTMSPSVFLGVAVDAASSELTLAGFTNGGSAEEDNILVQRVSASGMTLWQDTLNGAGNARDQAWAVGSAPDGGSAVVGEVFDGSRDMWIRVYEADGSVRWTQTVDSPEAGADEARGVAIDSQGAVVVVGRIDRGDLGQGSNAWIRKYDANGQELWTRTHNGAVNSFDSANAVAVDPDDRIIVVGKEGINDAQDGQVWMRMYTP